MNQEWVQLTRPFDLPSDAKVTVNDSGQRNYLFTYAGQKSWVPENQVKDGKVFVSPQVCSDCQIKALSNSNLMLNSDLGEFINNPKVKEWIPIAVVGLALAGLVIYGRNK